MATITMKATTAQEMFKDANGQRMMAISPRMVRVLGNIAAAAMLSQLMWISNGPGAMDEEGWFKASGERIEQETGLSRDYQQTAAKQLKALKVLEVERRGLPACNFWRINYGNALMLYEQEIDRDLTTQQRTNGGKFTSEKDPKKDPEEASLPPNQVDGDAVNLIAASPSTSERHRRQHSILDLLDLTTDQKIRSIEENGENSDEPFPEPPPEQPPLQAPKTTAQTIVTPGTTAGNFDPNNAEAIATRTITETMRQLGITISAWAVDEYMDLVADHTLIMVVRGMQDAAGQGKQNSLAYVKACIKNAATGVRPPAQPMKPTKPQQRGATNGAVRQEYTDKEREAIQAKQEQLNRWKREGVVITEAMQDDWSEWGVFQE